jgi:DNA polymerase III subunit delta'
MVDSDYELRAWDRLEGIPDPLENRGLVGHDATLDRLAAAYAGGKMHHAWLVTGPRGIGKATAIARFAGHVFRNPDPSGAPSRYVVPPEDDIAEARVARSAHPNLLHLRRPWNERDKRWRTELTVDEIRRTVPFFGNAPAEPGWRVAIVDTTDDLNLSAANALLKILEEPPPRTLFFLLADSWRGMLPTIRSRCQTLTLRPLEEMDTVAALQRLGILDEASEDDRKLVARLSGGSVRRAILIFRAGGLDLYRRYQALVSSPGNPDWVEIHRLAGEVSAASRDDAFRLLIDFARDDIAGKLRSAGKPGQYADISALAGWVEVWEKIARSADRTDAYNLDRKQVVLNLFSAFHGRA